MLPEELAVGHARRASHCAHREGDYLLVFDPSVVDTSQHLKDRTRRQTLAAVRRGTLTRLPCKVCGYPHTVAHHVDYADPLRVIWLCPNHHYEVHAGLLVLPADT